MMSLTFSVNNCQNGKTTFCYACESGKLDVAKWALAVTSADVNDRIGVGVLARILVVLFCACVCNQFCSGNVRADFV